MSDTDFAAVNAMLRIINALVQILFDILEGLVEFFRKLIPLLLKLIFALSPFLLAIYVAYLYGGTRLGLISAAIVVVLMVIGISYAYRNQLSGTGLSESVTVAVLVVDLLFLVAVGSKTSWFGLRSRSVPTVQSSSAPSTQQGTSSTSSSTSESTTPQAAKEKLLLELLNKSIQDDNYSESSRAISALVEMKSRASVPLMMEALRKYYPQANYTAYASPYTVSMNCMNSLAFLGATESCILLAEVSVKNPALTQKADEISKTLCQ